MLYAHGNILYSVVKTSILLKILIGMLIGIFGILKITREF